MRQGLKLFPNLLIGVSLAGVMSASDGKQVEVLNTVNPTFACGIRIPFCANSTFTARAVGRENLNQTDFLSNPDDLITVGSKGSPNCTVALVKSTCEEAMGVALIANPPLPIGNTSALAQLSLAGAWAKARSDLPKREEIVRIKSKRVLWFNMFFT